MLKKKSYFYPINIFEHQRQQSRRTPRNLSFLSDPQPKFYTKYDASKISFFHRATHFAVVHMLGEESFFVSNDNIWTPATAEQSNTPKFIIFWMTHNPNFRENMIPQKLLFSIESPTFLSFIWLEKKAVSNSINISEDQGQKSRRLPRNFIIFG